MIIYLCWYMIPYMSTPSNHIRFPVVMHVQVGKAKTRTKRGKTDEQDMFFNTCHGAEKSESRQG